MHHPKGPHMCDGINPLTGGPQSFYFPDDHPIIRGGSREWNKLSVSTAFGLRGGFLSSALAPSVLRDRPLAAAVTSFTHNLTSYRKNRSSRNISNHVVTCVIIIPSTTAN